MSERRIERLETVTEVEVRSAPAGHKIIEGYAAKFDRYSHDLGGFVEVVKPGFFERALTSPDIFGRYNHRTVLGRTGAGTLRVYTDATGLGYEIDVNSDDPEARSALAKVERGDVNRSSFAFSLTRDGDEWGETEQGYPLRELRSIGRLHDVSPVDEPAYPDTESGARTARMALRSLADAVEVDPAIVERAAEHGELIDLIRGARNLAPEVPDPPADRTTAAAPVVAVRLELERYAARRRAHRRPR